MNHEFKAVDSKPCAPDGPCDTCGVLTVYAPVGGGNFCFDCALSKCPAHGVQLGEGDICGECERLGDRELQLCKRIHPYTNEMFLKYYLNRRTALRHVPLMAIIRHGWCLGKDLTLLNCINMGYSLCVAKPLIDKIHDELDRGYELHQRALQDNEDGYEQLI